VNAYELGGSPITTVNEIYKHDTALEYDFLADTPCDGEYLIGIGAKDETESISGYSKAFKYHNFVQTAPNDVRFTYSLEQLELNAARRLGKGSSGVPDWNSFSWTDVPVVETRHVFFLGRESGEGGVLEVFSYYHPIGKLFVKKF
jgi:hypothetical protein